MPPCGVQVTLRAKRHSAQRLFIPAVPRVHRADLLLFPPPFATLFHSPPVVCAHCVRTSVCVCPTSPKWTPSTWRVHSESSRLRRTCRPLTRSQSAPTHTLNLTLPRNPPSAQSADAHHRAASPPPNLHPLTRRHPLQRSDGSRLRPAARATAPRASASPSPAPPDMFDTSLSSSPFTNRSPGRNGASPPARASLLALCFSTPIHLLSTNRLHRLLSAAHYYCRR